MEAELIRLSFFLAGLIIFSILEIFSPYRVPTRPKPHRWSYNISCALLGNLAARIIFSFGGAMGSALWAKEQDFGLLHYLDLPQAVEIIFGVLFLDLMIYLQHRASHRWKFLWFFHRLHHEDRDLDATTALRFHPAEIVLSMGYKIVLVALVGIDWQAVLVFEVALNFMALFNHSNLHLPRRWEKRIRTLVVTPQMHLAHHAVDMKKRNTNFGFNLSCWDRLFKTYTRSCDPNEEIGAPRTMT